MRVPPTVWAVVACVLLAALSAAVLPTVPSYDPWSWIVWGREIVDPHLSFATGGGPSWKPFPVIFTTIYGLFGSAAPTLWVITARAGGLLALVGAAALAARLTRRVTSAPVAGVIAAVVAVLGLALTQDFFYYMFRGTSEPLLIATAVWAVERLLERRHWQAFVLAVALSLIRPEAWPFLGVYAVWLWVRRPALRPLVLVGLLSVPFLWFVPPWVSSGQPFLAASHAKAYNGHLGAHPVLTAIGRAADLQIRPVLIAAAIAIVWAWVSERDRLTLALTAGALVWIAIVVGMAVEGYPGLERFFYPASAIFCVLAGVGVARVAMLAGDRLASGGVRVSAVAATVAALLLALSVPLASSRIDGARAAKPAADQAVSVLNQLSAAVRAAGGKAAVFPCRSSFAAVNHGVQTALAWKLRVTMGRVGTAMQRPGVDFVGPHNSVDGLAAALAPGLSVHQTVARAGVWRVVQVTAPGHPAPCVGR
jgi:hypothetical protein